MKKQAFTLAETLIVLIVIGILAAILLPVARNIAPDRNLMKFKKAHTTLGNVIRELVSSEQYYANGDLGVRADGTAINYYDTSNRTTHVKYFCQTIADVLNTKKTSCKDSTTNNYSSVVINSGLDAFYENKIQSVPITEETLNKSKERLDSVCKASANEAGEMIVLTDNVIFYETNPITTFGIIGVDTGVSYRSFAGPNEKSIFTDDSGFDTAYKIFCIDIDGIPNGITDDNCINECPFGYGIRADGKILTGKRADEWLEREK